MTTTNTFSGLDADGKPTSRVLRPPGGGSSDIFGTGNAPEAHHTGKRQHVHNENTKDDIFGQGTGEPVPGRNVDTSVMSAEPHKLAGKGRNQSRYNPITGEAYEIEGVEPEPPAKQPPKATPTAFNYGSPPPEEVRAVHTSTRTINPPGGRSSGPLW